VQKQLLEEIKRRRLADIKRLQAEIAAGDQRKGGPHNTPEVQEHQEVLRRTLYKLTQQMKESWRPKPRQQAEVLQLRLRSFSRRSDHEISVKNLHLFSKDQVPH
jgi:hypothetical protein